MAVNNIEGIALKDTDSKSLRQTKLLDNTQFSAETYIYDNKIAILDYNKDIIGVIIESQPIATSHKAVFEMVWKQL